MLRTTSWSVPVVLWWALQTTHSGACRAEVWELIWLSALQDSVLAHVCQGTQACKSCHRSYLTLLLAPAASLPQSFSRHWFLSASTVERGSPFKPKFFNIWTDIVLGIIKVYLIENYNQKFVQCSICQLLTITDIKCFTIQQLQQIICMCSFSELWCFKIVYSQMHYIFSKMF